MAISKEKFQKVVEFLTVNDIPQHADVIFVFGNYKALIAEHAAKLFHEGYAKTILVTGYKSQLLHVQEKNEASFYKKLLLDSGVPETSIIMDEEASNTLENVLFGMKKLHEQNIHPSKLLLVAHAGLLRRAKQTFKKQFPEIETICPPHPIPEEFWSAGRITRLLGEFDRFVQYAEKGDIAETEIPKDVQNIISEISENK